MMKRITSLSALFAATGVVVALVAPVVPVQAQADRSPVSAARFGISIDGVEVAVFAQLASEADLSTGATGKAMTLSGGRTRGTEMAAWHELVILGDVAAARKSATIVMYNAAGTAVKRYHLENAWPAKLLIDTDRALTTATVMLVYERLRVQGD